jgi:tetratricopeptide (TPR) repeat protein
MSRFGKLEFDGPRQDAVTRTLPPLADAARCLEEAWTAFGRAEFESSLRWFGRVLEFDPRSLVAWTGQVRSLIELGQYKEAGVWADKALERFPDAAELLAAKGVALGRLGRATEALPFSDAAVERPGETAYVWLARGDVLLAAGQRQVDHCFDRALQLSGADWLIRWLGARVRRHWQQFAAALRLAQEAAAQAPERFVTWMEAGRCQAELGLTEPALRSFHQALALYPTCREAESALQALQSEGWLTQTVKRLGHWLQR